MNARIYVRPLVRSALTQRAVCRLPCTTIWWQKTRSIPASRALATVPHFEDEHVKVGHSRFVAEASADEHWNNGVGNTAKGGDEGTGREVRDVEEGQGKLSPTSSHLFKLILPLKPPSSSSSSSVKPPSTVFLLHPSQPLSHLARLIASSYAPATPAISFRSISPDEPHHEEVEWSDSTDLADFIKSAVLEERFTIVLTSDPTSSIDTNTDPTTLKSRQEIRSITVRVPSFRDRTHFLRRRLRTIEEALREMQQLKRECDVEAHRGARRMAVGGFGMLITYWLGVARLTFYDYGWDVMEPITYLSGLSTVICGYLWFLYKGREVSYSSILNQSISKRRDALYESRGLDIERWVDLVTERKALRREMSKIAEDYDVRWDGRWDGDFQPREKAAREEDRREEKKRLREDTAHEGEGDKNVAKLREATRVDLDEHS